MGIPALKLKLAAVFCAAMLLLGGASKSQAADDAAAPPKPKAADGAADKADGAGAKTADAAKKPAEAKKVEENPCLWSSKAGAQLWAQDCRQCHNVRSPSTLSAAQWENAMAHMRFRCNLTAKEYRKIAALMQAASGGK